MLCYFTDQQAAEAMSRRVFIPLAHVLECTRMTVADLCGELASGRLLVRGLFSEAQRPDLGVRGDDLQAWIHNDDMPADLRRRIELAFGIR